MKKNKKLFAILTLVAFMMSLVPALAFADGATKATVKAEAGSPADNKVTVTATVTLDAAPTTATSFKVTVGTKSEKVDFTTTDTEKTATFEVDQTAEKQTLKVTAETLDGISIEYTNTTVTIDASAELRTNAAWLAYKADYTNADKLLDFQAAYQINEGSITTGPEAETAAKIAEPTVTVAVAERMLKVAGIIEEGGSEPPKPPVEYGTASVNASVIATKDAKASIESAATATTSFPSLDTKYTSIEIALKTAGNQAAKTIADMYIWAEESGKSGQATDALAVEGLEKVDAYTYGNVYKVPAFSNVAEYNIAFTRAGSFALKASLVDPTEDANQNGKLVSVPTFKTVDNKNTVTVTAPAQNTRLWTIDVVAAGTENGTIATDLIDGKTTDKSVVVAADTVATTKVTLTVKNDKGNVINNYPVKLSTNSANIELDKTTVTTDYNGNAEFNIAGVREGNYKVYVNIGDYEAIIKVQVGATSANDIQLIKFPSAPIATDTMTTDYEDFFRFQLTDANGNIVTGDAPKGAKYASMAAPISEKTSGEQAKYAYIVSAPEANKVKNADLTLEYVNGKDYYTLGVTDGKSFSAEGDYEIRVVLDNGKSATLNFSVKKFDKAVSLNIEYPVKTVELNSETAVPDIYFLDANGVMKKANNRVTVAASGYAVASVEGNGQNAGQLKVKNDEKYVGQTITVTAIAEKENLSATTTLTVADEAREVKLDTTRGQVNANNRVGFRVVDSTGNPVALGNEVTVGNIEVNAIVTNTGDKDAKVSYSVSGTSKSDLLNKGVGVISLSSNKETTATVQIMVKVTKNTTQSGDNNTGLSTTYYTGTETFTFGAEADKSVVMTIGSKEMVANNVPVTTDVAPFIQDNRTYVPFRALTEAFGAEVEYNAENNTVTTKLDGKTVVLTVGSTVLTVNDKTVTMDVAPFIVDDRVVVPVRFVGEAFGFTVEATQDADTGATASVVFYQK